MLSQVKSSNSAPSPSHYRSTLRNGLGGQGNLDRRYGLVATDLKVGFWILGKILKSSNSDLKNIQIKN